MQCHSWREIDLLLRVSVLKTLCPARNAFQDLGWMRDNAWSEADNAGHADAASISHGKKVSCRSGCPNSFLKLTFFHPSGTHPLLAERSQQLQRLAQISVSAVRSVALVSATRHRFGIDMIHPF